MNGLDSQKQSIREKVLAAIKAGDVTMRPKWHFMLRAILFVTGIVLMFLAIIYLASFIIFILSDTGTWFLPIFGAPGWFEFFRSLPWILILLALVFIIVMELLVRHYTFAYRQPLLYSAIGIIVLVVIGSTSLAALHFHDHFLRYAEDIHLPIASDFYHGFGTTHHDNVHLGTITTTTDDGFLIREHRGGILRVIISSQTRFPLGTDFAEGDTVLVFGARNDDMINALGVREVEEGTSSIPEFHRRPFRFSPAPH